MIKKIAYTIVLLLCLSITLCGCIIEKNEVSSDNTPSETVSVDDTPKVDAQNIWEEFLKNEGYISYTKEHEQSQMQYVIADVNADEVEELLIQDISEMRFCTSWLFTLDGEKPVLVKEVYGYGSFRYCRRHNCVIVPPEWAPFNGNMVLVFEKLEGNELVHQFDLGKSEGNYILTENSETKNVNETTWKGFTEDIKNLEWKNLK